MRWTGRLSHFDYVITYNRFLRIDGDASTSMTLLIAKHCYYNWGVWFLFSNVFALNGIDACGTQNTLFLRCQQKSSIDHPCQGCSDSFRNSGVLRVISATRWVGQFNPLACFSSVSGQAKVGNGLTEEAFYLLFSHTKFDSWEEPLCEKVL